MIGLLLLLGVALVSEPLTSALKQISKLQVESQVLLDKNFKVTNHELTNLEKQKESIWSLTQYRGYLYIGMRKDNLAKIFYDGKITQVPLGQVSDSNKDIVLMELFEGYLYLVNQSDRTSALLEMNYNSEFKQIYESGEGKFIYSLEIFDNDLYISVTSPTGSKLIKKDKGVFTEVKDFPGKMLSGLKTFNNHLYFVVGDATTSDIEINTLDTNGEVKKITELKNQEVSLHLTKYNNELYFSLYDGSLYKINTSNEVEKVVKRNLSSGPSSLVVFQNELYLGTSSKLEKLTKDDEIETVVEVPEVILSLTEYNDELYIGMVDGYFAKLS